MSEKSELHTVKNPLVLIWNDTSWHYKVNKPNQKRNQKLVSLEYAKNMQQDLNHANRMIKGLTNKLNDMVKKRYQLMSEIKALTQKI